ncbi:hypothetical protein [Photobacterium minamisatsumaniensis]|jgi:ribosome-binding protein aMBF1 (putative translation factor)|uniref:hypothetical protein n=1 Tax=Photobacterium minamisatsumaniensis TaxID=2910233 RepID=UPI003D0C0228
MNVTQLTPQSAQVAHKELLESLGSENNPQQWMIFMDAVDKHIPEMSSKGRLSAQTIERSLIGQLGFKSWKEYVESPLKSGGLNWSIGGWNSFRRAWTIVKDYPFLRQEEIKAGWLNALANELKKNEIEFPKTKRELEEIQNQKADKKAENKNSQLNEANEKIAELEEAVNKHRKESGLSQIENKELSAQIKLFDSITDKHIKKIETQATQISELKAKARQKPRKIGRLEALKILFLGD